MPIFLDEFLGLECFQNLPVARTRYSKKKEKIKGKSHDEEKIFLVVELIHIFLLVAR